MSAVLEFLASKLAVGPLQVGQVLCSADFRLRHVDDAGRDDLEVFTDPEEAASIARFDAAGEYRPLKTGPNLKQGWEFRLSSLAETRLAIDLLYPSALGNALAYDRRQLAGTNLRETLGRQTGMYAVTKKLTDEEASALVKTTCDASTKCLNHILWNISPGLPSPLTASPAQIGAEPIPLLCTEACPLLVAAAREVVKARPAA